MPAFKRVAVLAVATLPSLLAFNIIPSPSTNFHASSRLTLLEQNTARRGIVVASSRIRGEISSQSDDQPRVSRVRRILNFIRGKPSSPLTEDSALNMRAPSKRPAASTGDSLLGMDIVEAEADDQMMSVLKARMDSVSSAEEPQKRRKLYEGRKNMERKSPGAGGGDVAGAVMDRPSDVVARKRREFEESAKKPTQGSAKPATKDTAPRRRPRSERNPVGGAVDDDILDSVSAVPKARGEDTLANEDDIAKLNKMFGL